jgi:uncharacterized membrane protein
MPALQDPSALLEDPLAVAAVLALNVFVCEWLCARTWLRHLGTALLVIVLTAVQVNLGRGLIPTYGEEAVVYPATFAYLVPLSVFWLLLDVDLRRILAAGLPMLVLFLLGSAGVAAGVVLGMRVVNGPQAFGEFFAPLGGMLVGTYTGGSINLAAIATYYDVKSNAVLFAGANAVDAAMTTVWMAVCVVLPRLLARVWPTPRPGAGTVQVLEAPSERELTSPSDLALALGLGLLAVWASNLATAQLNAALGRQLPSILVLTTVALVAAQFGLGRRLRGARALGLCTVYVFLAVIGALCDLDSVHELGSMAVDLAILVSVVFVVHGVAIFGGAALFRLDPASAAVASQAGIGGGSTALALAKSLGRSDLVVPGILVGSLGTAFGTYLGFWVVDLLA